MISRLGLNIIDTHDSKTIGIVDTSWYNPDIAIETPVLEIIPPGYSQPVSPFFQARSLNIFNSNGVGITKASCEEELTELPDGLWKVKYSICPNDMLFIERFFLRTDRIQCKFTQAFLTLDLSDVNDEQQESNREKLQIIEDFIEGAIAASNKQNSKLASDLYKKADNLLDQFMGNRDFCGC
jgi:hypothetical protein